MFLIGLGAARSRRSLVYGTHCYWRGPLSGPDSSHRPVRDTLEPPRRDVRFLGLGTNWPGILLMAIGAILLVSGASF
jgi:hypothetical protein